MLSQEIRRNFLSYFKRHQHTIVASSSVVPHDDPSILFTNAGMNQFKDVFLGKNMRDYTKAATAQKCIRVGGKHNDLENVGHTSRHLTFFEMLGNFSFGDYFKKQAIVFAWEVSTQVFGFPEEKIWPTIFETDDEAFEIWRTIVPEKKITRLGEKDNFWAMGDTGPCGPCSELYFDRGPAFGPATCIKEDIQGERFLEFWNLVFMQFNRTKKEEMLPLPKQSIDTGSGLERVVSLKMGASSVFSTDILRSLIAEIESISGKKYHPEDTGSAPAFHVIADHIRSLSFAIADGAQPSNLDRGYVLRKLLRRAVRYGRSLGLYNPFLAKILPRLAEKMGDDYPELKESSSRIEEILTLEEEAFLRTLKRGGNILHNVIEKARISTTHQISGEDAFKLKDTYGFPLEEILLIAKDTSLSVNLKQYEELEEKAKEKSRNAQTISSQVAEENVFKDFLARQGATDFVGYTTSSNVGKILGLVKDGQLVEKLCHAEEGWILLDTTSFYPEKGGQVGDTGILKSGNALFKVVDCKSPFSGLIAHIGILERGELVLGESLHAEVDFERRKQIMAHHTATHLFHWALQQVLGPHIRQAGSLVEPNRLRFDFNHHKAVTKEELRRIEEIVNEKIRTNAAVTTYETSYEEVQKKGEIKQFFGDKYGSFVRVVDIDFSKELCGGTHVNHLGNIGLCRIVKEGSIAAGVRRLEAVCGKTAELFMYEQEDLLQNCAGLLKTLPQKTPEALSHLQQELKEQIQENKTYKKERLGHMAEGLLSSVKKGVRGDVLIAEVSLSSEEMSLLADEIMQKLSSLILILGTKIEERAQILARISPSLVSQGVSAVQIIKEIAPLIGGSGGGREISAQAGGKDPSALTKALEKAATLLS